jgi:hypothetical protein
MGKKNRKCEKAFRKLVKVHDTYKNNCTDPATCQGRHFFVNYFREKFEKHASTMEDKQNIRTVFTRPEFQRDLQKFLESLTAQMAARACQPGAKYELVYRQRLNDVAVDLMDAVKAGPVNPLLVQHIHENVVPQSLYGPLPQSTLTNILKNVGGSGTRMWPMSASEKMKALDIMSSIISTGLHLPRNSTYDLLKEILDDDEKEGDKRKLEAKVYKLFNEGKEITKDDLSRLLSFVIVVSPKNEHLVKFLKHHKLNDEGKTKEQYQDALDAWVKSLDYNHISKYYIELKQLLVQVALQRPLGTFDVLFMQTVTSIWNTLLKQDDSKPGKLKLPEHLGGDKVRAKFNELSKQAKDGDMKKYLTELLPLLKDVCQNVSKFFTRKCNNQITFAVKRTYADNECKLIVESAKQLEKVIDEVIQYVYFNKYREFDDKATELAELHLLRNISDALKSDDYSEINKELEKSKTTVAGSYQPQKKTRRKTM